MTDVRFSRVRKAFGPVAALAGLDLEIRSGEFVSLLGPSGSGKSTTLNLLAGLLDADSGDIAIGGTRVNDLSPDKRDIAMVFQNYALYPHMTVFENLAFPLRARGRAFNEGQIKTKVEAAAESLGVAALLARYPKELSGGQQQRIALGRAMVRDPKVFLLDEPLSNLDARLRIRMRRDIKALHDRIKSTIVYVTHDQAEALTMSTRIAVFDQGHLQQYGTPNQIYHRPANMFVANFVGEREINFVNGAIAANGGKASFVADGLTLPLAEEKRWRNLRAGKSVLGIRTEAIKAVRGDTGTPAIVEQVELVGPELVVYAAVGTAQLSCRADLNADLKPGDKVRLVFDPAHFHFFEPDGGASLAGAEG
ncbi:MAG: ABC transporter ATP-binding protein [Alphaproteobacteria bacterium]|nr:ABC transporter ATP-binding protein [Alphaproteobacteria bacterium]